MRCVLAVLLVILSVHITPAVADACEAYPIHGLKLGGNVTLFGNTDSSRTYASQVNTDCNTGTTGMFWYSLTVDAGWKVTVSTCGAGTEFDTVLGAYRGSCSRPLCVNGNDDACGSQSSLVFNTDGDVAYIGVTGYSSTSHGNFQLTLSAVPVADPTCLNSIPLDGPFQTPLVINANTQTDGANSTVVLCNLDESTNEIWYLVNTVSLQPVTFSTCGAGTDFDTQLSLFSQNCSTLTCLEYQTSSCPGIGVTGSTLTVIPTLLSRYNLVVTAAQSGDFGNFELQVSQTFYPVSICTSSPLLDLSTVRTVEGSTVDGVTIVSPVCGDENGPSTWFTIRSDYAITFTMNACTEYTDFEASLALYDECSNPICLASQSSCDDPDGTGLTYSLSAREIAYLVVSSADGSSGNFFIEITIE